MLLKVAYFIQVFRVTSVTHVSASRRVLHVLPIGFASIELREGRLANRIYSAYVLGSLF
jgi:hypothetical protein